MGRRRFFVDEVRGGVAELRGEEARHLTRVLRVENGQRFEISDNESAWLAEIAEARGERVVFRIIESIESPANVVHVTLFAGLVKFDRFEWMIEKATELGVDRIVPVNCQRSEKGLLEASAKREVRWRRVARESSQQSRRVHIPELTAAMKFDRAVTDSSPHRYFLDEAGGAPLLRVLPEQRAAGARVALLLGPEGGWTEIERKAAEESGWKTASLGPHILRAETAATAALAIVVNGWMV